MLTKPGHKLNIFREILRHTESSHTALRALLNVRRHKRLSHTNKIIETLMIIMVMHALRYIMTITITAVEFYINKQLIVHATFMIKRLLDGGDCS